MDDPPYLYRESDDPRWYWVIEVMDLFSSCGEEEAAEMSGNPKFQFCASIGLIPAFSVLRDDIRTHIEDDRGLDPEDLKDLSDADWLWDIHCYGAVVPGSHCEYASTEKQAIRKLKRVIDLDVDSVLGAVVNQMGQTGLGYIDNSIDQIKYEEKNPNAVVPERVH